MVAACHARVECGIDLGGAAVYVGMTRGRNANTLHIVAENMADARAQFIEAMERDRADRGLAEATERAAEAVRGLVADGPMKLVNDEIARLVREAERAEQRAVLWQHAADALAELHTAQHDRYHQASQTSNTAAKEVGLVRAEVAAPLIAQARTALAEGQDADATYMATRDRLRAAGKFGNRLATSNHTAAQALAQAAEQRLASTWGGLPWWNEDSASWVERVTRARIDADPRVIEATAKRDAAAEALHKALEPDRWPRLHIYTRIFGAETVMRNRASYLNAPPHSNAENQARTARQARTEIETLRALAPVDAVRRIEQTHAVQETARDAADRGHEERRRQLGPTSRAHESGPLRGGPSLSR